MEHSRGDVTQGSQGTPERRELRPFPAIDPEPDHRFQWRTLMRAGIALLAACAVAAAVAGGVRLANAARHPASAPAAASAPFTDTDGLIVFEQQPSGLLGTADPDGSHQVIDKSLGGLQGNDLATASPDGRYLVNEEAQLVRVGARGPTAVAQLAASGLHFYPFLDQRTSTFLFVAFILLMAIGVSGAIAWVAQKHVIAAAVLGIVVVGLWVHAVTWLPTLNIGKSAARGMQ